VPDPQYAPARQWTTKRRYEAAIKGVLDNEETLNEMARRYGVDRSHLTKRVADAREARARRVEKARAELAKDRADRSPVDDEFPSFREFWDAYFAGTICPDCGVHHEFPEFHGEMIDASLDPAVRRLVINLPPYHAKTTCISVWRTIYKLCQNPGYRVIIVSKSQDFARIIVGAIKQYLTNHELYLDASRDLIDDYGPFHAAGSKNVWSSTELRIDTRTDAEKDPNVVALGAGGQIYGRRAEDIIFDDFATLENCHTPDAVAKLMGWVDKEALSRIGKNGKAIWVGTRINGHDPYGILCKRRGYRVIQYSCILDDDTERVLWPEHFPYSQAIVHREEMSIADWQLVYQNVDTLGAMASFPPDVIEAAKDPTRVLGHYERHWMLVGGVDPAGGKKGSGYTAVSVVGIDFADGKMYLVDQIAKKGMPAFQLKDTMLAWSDEYPIKVWRCEDTGLQDQLFQYNRELVQPLARKGVRVEGHTTGKLGRTGKWDPQFGVESMAPMFAHDLFSIPWGSPATQAQMQPLVEQLLGFPLSAIFDRVMSLWFAYLGCKYKMEGGHLPMFSERSTKRWPRSVLRRRKVVDFQQGRVDSVPISQQRPGTPYASPYANAKTAHRRAVVGRPAMPHPDETHWVDRPLVQMANVAQSIDPETGEVLHDEAG